MTYFNGFHLSRIMMKLKSYEIVIEQIIVNSFMVVKVTQEMSQYLQLCHKVIHPKYSKH